MVMMEALGVDRMVRWPLFFALRVFSVLGGWVPGSAVPTNPLERIRVRSAPLKRAGFTRHYRIPLKLIRLREPERPGLTEPR